DDERRRIVGAADRRIVGRDGGFVGAVQVGIVGDAGLVGDRRPGIARLDGGGDGDGDAAGGRNGAVPGHGVGGHRRDGDPGGGGRADQGERHRQDVGQLVAGVVRRGRAAAVGDHDGVGDRAAGLEGAGGGLRSGERRRGDDERGGIGGAADRRIVGEAGGVVRRVVVAVERGGALVGDRGALGPGVDGGGDGDGDAAAERCQRAVPVDRVTGSSRRAAGRGGAHQGEAGR